MLLYVIKLIVSGNQGQQDKHKEA